MIGKLVITAATAAATLVVAPLNEAEFTSAHINYAVRCYAAMSWFVGYVPTYTKGRIFLMADEAYRPQILANIYAASGKGIRNSLHTKRLAFDTIAIVDGKVSFEVSDYKPLADLWLSTASKFGVEPAAGYYFKKVDAVHFSCAWQGVK